MKIAFPPTIEPLESRIAPALLVQGANLLGAGNPTTGESSVGGTSVTLVKVLTGAAVVWYDGSHIVGISFGPNATLDVTGSILGDVVGNLGADGRLSDSDHDVTNGEDGNVLLPNNLLGLSVHALGADLGSIAAIDQKDFSGHGFSIITGGSVSNVNINFALGGIYAGDGVFHDLSYYNSGGTVTASVTNVAGRPPIDANPIEPGVQVGFTFTSAIQADAANAPLVPGASIKNVSMGKAFALQMIAGSGGATSATGAGAIGGSISSINIDTAQAPSDAPANTLSYQLIGGDGANGVKGGTGGSIVKVIEKSSSGLVDVQAGEGGNGSAGAGGAGGSILSLDLQSSVTTYTGKAGDGGQGTPGGAGGSVTNANFANRTSSSGLVFTADFTGDGILDVAVVDGGTGRVVIAKQAADGTFDLVTQYTDNADPLNPVDVKIVPSLGLLPSDGAVVDFDANGKPDLVLAYKGSNSVVVLLNQSAGSFYDVTDADNPKLKSLSVGLTGSPNAIDVDPSNPGLIAVAGSTESKNKEIGTLELLTRQNDPIGGVSIAKFGKETNFAVPVTDVTLARVDSGFSGVVASLKSGVLFTASIAQQTDSNPTPAFTDVKDFATLTGGVRQVEISSDGKMLAALGTNSGVVSLFDTSLSVPAVIGDLPAPGGGKATVIRFVDDGVDDTPDMLFVLSNGTGASRLTEYVGDSSTPPVYQISKAFDSGKVFRNFAGFGTAAAPGFAAVTSAVNFFAFSSDFATTSEQTLPFSAGKTVNLTAGNGGAGIDATIGGKLKVGNGGAGGSVSSVNIEATTIKLVSGTGGGTQTGAGGAGGSIVNPLTFIPASGGEPVAPHILAEDNLTLTAGDGGSPTTVTNALTAAGGDGGSLRGLVIELTKGDILPNLTLAAGTGGNSFGGKAGAGGSIVGVTTTIHDSSLAVVGGQGGNANGSTGAGGAGGAVTNFKHTLTLDSETESSFKAYSVAITSGHGGNAIGGVGGAGGALTGIVLDIDNSNRNEDDDSDPSAGNVTMTLTSGSGGNGTIGGAGGSLSGLNYTTHHDQIGRSGGVIKGYLTMSITLGDGGNGSVGAGGNGGAFKGGIPISGLTGFNPNVAPSFDAPLVVQAGNGGNGVTVGGIGGSITGLEARNALFFDGAHISGTHLRGAMLVAGDGGNASGGNGGAGGSIGNTLIGVDGAGLLAYAGAGGDGAGTAKAKGGAGGSINAGSYGFVGRSSGLNYIVAGGDGGTGVAAGGLGGSVSGTNINIQQSTSGAGISILSGGSGGDATGTGGVGGKGGDVKNVGHFKDLNSVITAIYAGTGGSAAQGIGGVGGGVSAIKVLGTIGQAADNSLGGTDRYGVFNPNLVEPDFPQGIPQGIFAGRGGVGANAVKALAGSVTNVTARQIAAIAALSATPGLFVAANKVSGIKADVIGFDADRDGNFDGATIDPRTGIPIDGFIVATTLGPITGIHKFDFIGV